MNASPAVTVVVPAYEPGPRLRLALGDVCAQSIPHWECIVVDDGGDQDLAWVDDLDPRIRRYRQPNGGVSVARNRGVDLADTALIAFLDQDDRWHPDRLAASLDLARMRPDAAFWSTQFRWQLPERSQVTTYPATGTHLWYLAEGGSCQSAMTVRRADYTAVGGQDPRLRMCQDFDFALRLMRHLDAPAAIDPRELVTYTVHESNASTDFWRTDREFRQIYRAERREGRARGEDATVRACRVGLRMRRRTHAYQAVDAARRAWGMGDRAATATALARGAWCDPTVLVRESLRHGGRVVSRG